jgi:chromosome partitioning protein
VCARVFVPELAFQVAHIGGVRRYFCQVECRRAALGETGFTGRRARRVAVLNQKGGTGKTTTAINLAAGIADRGHDVLLIDLDPQGSVGASLGVRGERSLYHLMVQRPVVGADGRARPVEVDDVIIPVRGHLDVITADASLAMAEVHLARLASGRERVLAERLAPVKRRYQYLVIDCSPSLSLLNQNALAFVDEVLVPVSCDYLALVGLRQVLDTLARVDRNLSHGVRLAGVVPTFFDPRTRIGREAVATLERHFAESVYAPVRRSTRLAEAPSHRKTIFEYSPDSAGAADYRRVVERFLHSAERARAPFEPPTPPAPSKVASISL